MKIKFQLFMKRNSTDSRKKAKMLATERRSHEPIDTLTVISRRQLGKRQGGSRVDAVELKTGGILFELLFLFFFQIFSIFYKWLIFTLTPVLSGIQGVKSKESCQRNCPTKRPTFKGWGTTYCPPSLARRGFLPLPAVYLQGLGCLTAIRWPLAGVGRHLA